MMKVPLLFHMDDLVTHPYGIDILLLSHMDDLLSPPYEVSDIIIS